MTDAEEGAAAGGAARGMVALLGLIDAERAREHAARTAAEQRASNERMAALQAELREHVADRAAADRDAAAEDVAAAAPTVRHVVAVDPAPPAATILGFPPAVALGAVAVGGATLWIVANALLRVRDKRRAAKRSKRR